MGGRTRPLVLAGTAIALGVVAPLALAELVLQFAPVMSGLYTRAVNERHPLARFEPDRNFTYSLGPTFDVVVRGRINNAGWVNDQEYDSTATTPLLAVVGDSYVEALMVPYRNTLQGRLAAAAGARARVYSFGSSGAPLAHYLAIAEHVGTTYHPSGAVFVVVGNDFDESLFRYKRAPGLFGFGEDSAGRLRLERTDYAPSAWRRFVRKSALARYLTGNVKLPALVQALRARRGAPEPGAYAGNVDARADSTRLADSRRAADEFLRQLPGSIRLAPSRIAFVVDGVRPQLYEDSTRAAGDSSYFGRMRRYFMAAATAAGYEVVDMQPRFVAHHRQSGRIFELPTDGHWNGLGHQLAAEAVQGTHVYAHVLGKDTALAASP